MPGGATPWVLSGRGGDALRGQATRLREFIAAGAELDVLDLGFSLAGRATLEHRGVVVGADRESLLSSLDALADGPQRSGVAVGGDRLGILFSGQGSQRVGMGRELHDAFPVFRTAFDELCEELDGLLGCSLRAVVFEGDGDRSLDETMFTQAGLFAVEVALYRLVESWGVRPAVLVGHSIGEIAAAFVAGVFSLKDACRLVAARGRLMGALPAGGAMVSLEASEQEVRESLAGDAQRMSLAAVNGPRSVVVSGDEAAVLELAESFRARGCRTKRLRVSHAFHSPLMDAMLDDFRSAVSALRFAEPAIPIVSNLTGELLSPRELCEADYWVRHVREPVRFMDGVRCAREQGVASYLELGPGGVLSAMTLDCLSDPSEDRSVAAVPVLREGRPEAEVLLAALGEIWVRGVEVDWPGMFEGTGAQRVALPTYAFQRQRYWFEPSRGAGNLVAAGQRSSAHPLLGAMLSLPAGGRLLTGRLSLESHPWLADHAVLDAVLLPGAALLELAVHAGQQVGCPLVKELTLQAPLLIPESGGVQLQVTVGALDEQGQRTLTIHARPEGAERGEEDEDWVCHAVGALIADGDAESGLGQDSRLAGVWPPEGARELDVDDVYDVLAAQGLEYGPAFQGLTRVWSRGEELYAEVSLPETQREEADSYAIHPALLDAALHALGARLLGGSSDAEQGLSLPFSWNDVSLNGGGAGELRVGLAIEAESGASLVAGDASGEILARVRSLQTRVVSAAQLGEARGAAGQSLLKVDWVAAPEPSEGATTAAGAGASGIELVDVDDWMQESADVPVALRRALAAVVGLLAERTGADGPDGGLLVLVSHGLVSVDGGGTGPGGLIAGGVLGLVRSVQAEHPGRIAWVDVDGGEVDWGVLPALTESGESQFAVRDGSWLVRRLRRVEEEPVLAGADGTGAGLCLVAGGDGSLESLTLVPCEQSTGALGAGEVRVGVRAAGVNFRDVLVALGVYPGGGVMGGEGAGVVLEVGPHVEGLAAGDHVLGLWEGFGSEVVADARLLTRVPTGWSYAQAASMPAVFLTAYYGLVELGGLGSGERVLIHAAAGGVGMAAVQIAKHLGAEVFATASESKWGVLEGLGLDAAHIASSRSLEFGERFRQATGDRGFDLVLDSLAGELVDEGLGLLRPGGRFLELGKTDVRDADAVADAHPGVAYRAFDLMEAGPERLQTMLAELLRLFEAGVLEPLPVKTWDVRRAPEAFRFMSQARHVGKLVLTYPTIGEQPGTVLVTGGSGGLGGLVARALVAEHAVRSLVLASRSGIAAAGAEQLRDELVGMGARVEVVACDVGDRAALAELVEGLRGELWGVVHAAGVLDDGVLASITPERMDAVLAGKADGAWFLHELTKGLELGLFALFSSAAGVVGNPGQGAYAAANAFLDALAEHRRSRGLAGVALAWGLWDGPGMGATLGETDRARLARSGVGMLSPAQGLQLFDAGIKSSEASLLCAALDPGALRVSSRDGTLPPLLSGLVRGARAGATVARGGHRALVARLEGLDATQRRAAVLELVLAESAGVLGHSSWRAVDPERAFKELGFDSLAAVELRNRVAAKSGLTLPATLIFDHPTPNALTSLLLEELDVSAGTGVGIDADPDASVRELIASIPLARLRRAGMMDALLALAAGDEAGSLEELSAQADLIETMDIEQLAELTLEGSGE